LATKYSIIGFFFALLFFIFVILGKHPAFVFIPYSCANIAFGFAFLIYKTKTSNFSEHLESSPKLFFLVWGIILLLLSAFWDKFYEFFLPFTFGIPIGLLLIFGMCLELKKIWKKIISNTIQLSLAIFGIALSLTILLSWIIQKPTDYDSFAEGVLVEMVGMLFDILLLLLLFNWINEKGEHKRRIQQLKDEIDDFRGWDEKEAMFRIVGNIKRLNRLGVVKLDLTGCFLKEANLSLLNLESSALSDCNLEDSKLHSTCLRKTEIRNVNLNFSKLWKANIEEAFMENVSAIGCNLQYASLVKSYFREVNLHSANLFGSSWIGALLHGVNFKEAILNNSWLTDVDFRDVNLNNADLTGSHLDGAKVYREDWFEYLKDCKVTGIEDLTNRYEIALPSKQDVNDPFFVIQERHSYTKIKDDLPQRCHALTRTNQRCKNFVKKGKFYCKEHINDPRYPHRKS